MKYLVILSLLTINACAPLAVAGIGGVTGVALTTNFPAVEKFGDEYLKTEK